MKKYDFYSKRDPVKNFSPMPNEIFYLGLSYGAIAVYTDPALVDQAEEIGKIFAAGGLTITAFNRMQRTLKSAARLPYEAQQGAFKKVLTQVTDLENQKKSPPLLREVVERNQAAVQTEADFAACLDHFKDIAVYLVAQAASAGT